MDDQQATGTDTQPAEETTTPSPAPEASPPPPPARADLLKRFVAMLIDGVICLVVGLIPIVGGLITTAYWLCRDGLEIDFMDQRSIGKKLVKIRPVTEDGSKTDLAASIKRNWMFGLGGLAQLLAGIWLIGWLPAIPVAILAFLLLLLEVVLVLVDDQGRRMGDRIAGTTVIATED